MTETLYSLVINVGALLATPFLTILGRCKQSPYHLNYFFTSWITILVFAFTFSATIVSAHESRPAYLELIQASEETYDITWKVPAKSPTERLGLKPLFPENAKKVSVPLVEYKGAAIIERYSLSRPGGLAGGEIYIEGLSRTLTDVLVRIELLDGTILIQRLSPDAPSFVVGSVPGSMEVAKTYSVLGIKHILTGMDHLLFVACLMMVAGTGRKLFITITGFTIAHSLTLALSTLNLVQLPVAPVEAVIALSILFVATEIARGSKDTLTYKHPIAVSSSFGLLHGFGFATVLREIGLPQTEIATGLLFFNVGVELGQLMFVLGVLLILFIIKSVISSISKSAAFSVSSLSKLETPAAYIIGSLAAFWTIQRVSSFWI